jgi:hypothetical protein
MSKLRHFATLPVLSVYDVKQKNRPAEEWICHHTKPKGLWVSDEAAEMGWREWCNAEGFGLGVLEHEVVLAPSANILRITSVAELDDFGAHYGKCPDHQYFRDEPCIMWGDVAQEYDGILITPYQWERRLETGSSWYYGWDCASGCIWRARAVERIEPLLSPRDAAEAIEAAVAP